MATQHAVAHDEAVGSFMPWFDGTCGVSLFSNNVLVHTSFGKRTRLTAKKKAPTFVVQCLASPTSSHSVARYVRGYRSLLGAMFAEAP